MCGHMTTRRERFSSTINYSQITILDWSHQGKENTIKNGWEDESSDMGPAKIDAAFSQDNSVYFLKVQMFLL